MPAQRVTPTETKLCANCGKPFTRNRRPNGRLEPRAEYDARKTCGNQCGSQITARALTKPFTHPPCPTCGKEVTQREGESRQAWRQRKTCGPDCLHERRASNGRAGGLLRTEKLRPNDPCRACGGPVERREGERASDWRKRVTCSVSCSSEMKRRGARASNVSPARVEARKRSVTVRVRPARPARVAVPRRVEFRGFPTPPEVASQWRTVTGDALPPVDWNNSVTRSPLRPANLRAALDYHPDLATALAGLLTDSWHPHAPTPPSYEGGTT
jgi:hypothetical protein